MLRQKLDELSIEKEQIEIKKRTYKEAVKQLEQERLNVE